MERRDAFNVQKRALGEEKEEIKKRSARSTNATIQKEPREQMAIMTGKTVYGEEMGRDSSI